MIAEERLIAKIHNLPPGEINEVIDFVDSLTEKNGKRSNGLKLSPQQKAKAIERWAKGHTGDTPIILDDRREIIYED